jgi:hypothetical protein
MKLLPLVLAALLALAACAHEPKRDPKTPSEHTNHHHHD